MANIGRRLRRRCSEKLRGVLSRQVVMHAFVIPGKRYDVGDVESYRSVCRVLRGRRTLGPGPGNKWVAMRRLLINVELNRKEEQGEEWIC